MILLTLKIMLILRNIKNNKLHKYCAKYVKKREKCAILLKYCAFLFAFRQKYDKTM